MAHRIALSSLAALGLQSLPACAVLPDSAGTPAVIADPTDRSRRELAAVIHEALGEVPVTLADDALTGSPASLIQVEFSYTFLLEDEWKPAYAPGVESVTEFAFLAEISDGSEPILSFEHDLYEWMPYAPAMRRLKWPNNQRALEFCNCLLTS